MTQNTTFEVHVQRGGQWTIHETYKGDQREPALEDAREQLSRGNNIDAVKVVKETLDPDSGIYNDSVIFKADVPKKTTQKKRTAPPRAEGQYRRHRHCRKTGKA